MPTKTLCLQRCVSQAAPRCDRSIGFANVGWNRPTPTREVQTPTLDGLVAAGIQLTGFYAFKYCSPSRSAFLSGRNPIHVNVVNGQTSRRRDCNSADAPSPCLLKRLIQGEGGAAE